MRLIDADSFLGFMTALEEAGAEHISFDDLKKFISEQRTAYDVDKIVKQIRASGTDEDGIVLYVNRKPVIAKELAVKIVKSSGVCNSD